MPTVLIPHQTGGNIYIRELGRAYARLGWTPIYGSENLLEANCRPELVHLHWPEEFYRWRGEGRPERRVEHFLARLSALAEAGIPTAWTVHNLAPHDKPDHPLDAAVYQAMAKQADCIHHHCPNSVQLLSQRYPVPASTCQFVATHGHYLGYANHISKAEARKRLGIPADARVFLQFGQIRGYKGLNLLFAAFDQLRLDRKFLLVAGLYNAPTGPGAWRERLGLIWRKRTSANLLVHGRAIDSDDIQIYANAADCMVLSHTAGLNSGVAILGMSFGKPVIGPDLGCLGWVLGQGPNRVYPTGDAAALAAVMQAAFDDPAKLEATGRDNLRVAGQWQWEGIAGEVLTRLKLRA